jgi:diguanylate cyclase (GGDEF)-like protein
MSLPNTNSVTHNAVVPLTDAARSALIALIRVVELTDPAVAHRSALRALVASRLCHTLGESAGEATLAIGTAAVADIDLFITRPDPEAAPRTLERSMLSTTLVDRLEGLVSIAHGLRHQDEFWDGSGGPSGLRATEIPFASRIAAATDVVVGNPAAGLLPTWRRTIARTKLQRGARLDPQIVDSLDEIDVESIEIPALASGCVGDLLAEMSPVEPARAESSAADDVATAVAAAARVDDLMQLFADISLRSIDAANVSILRMTRTSIEDSPVAEANDGRETIVTPERLADLTEFSTVAELRAGQPVVRSTLLHTGETNVATSTVRMTALGLGSEITVPIMLGDEAWGVMSAARRIEDHHLDSTDVDILVDIATKASASLANTLRWEQIEHMALRDQLTGLSNRHVLYTVLDNIFEREPVDRLDCAVIMCDVDGLKAVNDTRGHEAGDRLLIDAAIALRGAVRDPERSTICRIGGDEFCLVIDGGALLTAHEVSDTIERLFERSGGPDVTRSISCGIAFAGEDIHSRSELLRAADENQYETKRTRRAARGEPIDASPRGRGGDRRAIRD